MSAAIIRQTMRLSHLPRQRLMPLSPISSSSFFSTTTRRLTSSGQKSTNANPELPAFSLKSIASTPRGRMYLGAGFLVLCGIEGLAWYEFGPKIMGWDKKEE